MATKSNSSWWATFYCWQKDGRAEVVTVGSGQSGGDLISFSVNKRVDSPGRFNLTLVPHKIINYQAVITPNSPFELWIDSGDGTPPQCFTGFVDRVARTRMIDEHGKANVRIAVSARDFSKGFMKTSIFFSAQYNKNAESLVTRARIAQRFFLAQSQSPDVKGKSFFRPSEYAWLFIYAYLNENSTFLLLPTASGSIAALKYINVIDTSSFVAPFEDFNYLKAQMFDRSLGGFNNLWELIRSYSHGMLNELYVDTLPESEAPRRSARTLNALELRAHAGYNHALSQESYFGQQDHNRRYDTWRPRLVFRPRPYLLKDMAQLKRHDLDARLINYDNLGLDDHTVKNLFKVHPIPMGRSVDTTLGTGANVADIAVINPESMAKHGVNRMEVQSDFCWPSFERALKGNAQSRNFVAVAREQTQIIALQHARNDSLLNGSISTAYVKPEIRVGNALRIFNERTSEDNSFYIEGYDHSGTAGQKTTSTFSLVRGVATQELDAAKTTTRNLEAEIKQSGLQWLQIENGEQVNSSYDPATATTGVG